MAVGDRRAFAIAIAEQESRSCASVTFHNILDRMRDLIPYPANCHRRPLGRRKYLRAKLHLLRLRHIQSRSCALFLQFSIRESAARL